MISENLKGVEATAEVTAASVDNLKLIRDRKSDIGFTLAVWMLGLAVPVTASYIIAAVMVAPAMVKVGIEPVAAHMFIFYYAVLSEVSPPTALAPSAAAALTGGNPFKTMMLTWKYTLPAFLVPFVFTLDPRGMGVLLQGPIVDIVWTSATAALGVAALAMGLGG